MRSRSISSVSNVRTINIEFVGQAPTTRGEEVGKLGDSSSSSSASKTAWRSMQSQSVDSVLPESSIRAPLTCVGASSSRSERLGSGSEQLGSKSELLDSRSEPLASKSKQLSSRSEQPSSRSEQRSSGSEQRSSRSAQLGSRSEESSKSEQLSSRSEQHGPRSEHSSRLEQQLGSSSDRQGSGSGMTASSPASRSPTTCASSSSMMSSSSSLPRRAGGSESRTPGLLSLLSSSTPVLPSRSPQDGGAGSPQGGKWVVGGRSLFSPNSELSQQSPEGVVVTTRFGTGLQQVSSPAARTSDTTASTRPLDDLASSQGPPSQPQVSQRSFLQQGNQAAPTTTTSGTVHHFRSRMSPFPPRLVSSTALPGVRTVPVQVIGGAGSNLRLTAASSLARPPQVLGAPTQGPPSSATAAQEDSRHVLTARLSSPEESSVPRAMPRPTLPQQQQQQSSEDNQQQHHHQPAVFMPTLRLSPPSLVVPARLSSQTTPAPTRQQPQPQQQQQQQQQQRPAPRVFGSPGARPRLVTPLFRSKLSPILPRHAALRTRLPVSVSPGAGHVPIPVKHVDTCSACLKTSSTPAQLSAAGAGAGAASGSGGSSASDVRGRSDATAGKEETSCGRSSSDGGGVRARDDTAAVLLPGGVLKLLEKSAGAAEGGGGGGGRSEGEGRTIPILDLRKEVPWKERRSRIDSALSWLRSELVSRAAGGVEEWMD